MREIQGVRIMAASEALEEYGLDLTDVFQDPDIEHFTVYATGMLGMWRRVEAIVYRDEDDGCPKSETGFHHRHPLMTSQQAGGVKTQVKLCCWCQPGGEG